ncbi:MAG: hypothetical protein KDD50_15525 [Bdellovibrionales bacterium]|nr:hypothetical protein [Bdellovibrionales bacterium]MCB9815026.1 hypothetical protein [Candidatus Nomurabacteria bacterium]
MPEGIYENSDPYPTQEQLDQSIKNTLDELGKKMAEWNIIVKQLREHYMQLGTGRLSDDDTKDQIKYLEDSLAVSIKSIKDLQQILKAHHKIEDSL